MRLVGRGLSNREIAEVLGISPETVKSHVHRVMRTFGVRDRWTAAARLSG
jgi:DNA-binding NarL/FixJ family response regulator